MKKSIIIILAVVAILVIWAVSVYNGLVTMDENVSGQWANVETQYQRRADLIPNLVNTVKGYASHEKETLEGVVEARSKATQIKVDAEGLTPEKLAEYQKAQGAVTSALGRCNFKRTDQKMQCRNADEPHQADHSLPVYFLLP